MKIYAFIVTYNRLESLKKTLHCLRNQTALIEEIFVVNNSSTDGTSEWLSLQENLKIITQENLGGAGGFSTGVEYAYKQKADWVWMMDDDVYPRTDCLEILLSYSDKSKCLHPTRYHIDGVRVEWGYYYDIFNNKEIKLNKQNYNKDIFYTNVGCFEGMLVHRSIIDKIGFPDKRFFISGDDSIYGFLANRYTNVSLVRNAIMDRMSYSYQEKISPFYIYYLIRNYHLKAEYCKILENKNGFSRCAKISMVLYILKSCTYRYVGLSYGLMSAMIKYSLYGALDALRKKTGNTYK